MSNMLYRATKYMNTEDVLLAREEKPRNRERQEKAWQDMGQNSTRTGDRQKDKQSKPPMGRRFTNFTLLTARIDQVLMQIKDNTTLMWPSKLKGDPSKRSRDKYFGFHWDQGHDTFECYDLKQ